MRNNIAEALKELKSRYDNGEVSALVGAGFSKNVSAELFPNWSQLLEDMVLFTYEDEISQNYRNYCHLNIGGKAKSLQDYKKTMTTEIIRRDGYLKIVDNYIHKKGFREAVETYIEERTPHIQNFDDDSSELKLFCSNKGSESVTIPNEKLNLHHKLLSCSWDNIFTTNYDCLLEYVVKHRNLAWDKPIVNSSGLSFRSKKPIIKIHGSLSDSTITDFCFDNDHNKRYVICSEDYDSYPKKHEAFTQYMRISLLKGCFCLFGFSGDDQNFISWVKWVRDILVKVPLPNSEGENHTKVFLLSINNDTPSREKQLYYDNHNIAYIPLGNNNIKKELGVSEEVTAIATIYNAFFDYLLKSQDVYSAPAPGVDEYPKLWRSVAKFNSQTVNRKRIVSAEIDTLVLDKIITKQASLRFTKKIDPQQYVLSELYMKENLSGQEIKLAVAALKDTQQLPSYYKALAESIESSLNDIEPTTAIAFEQFCIREQTIKGQAAPINNALIPRDDLVYEQSFYFAFNLDFTALKNVLDNWDTKEGWAPQRKAIMLSMFDEEESKSSLLDYLDTTNNYNEKYYTTDLLNYVYRTYPVKFPTDDFKHKKIDGIYDYIDFFIANIKKQKEKITPLGDNQITHSLSKETTKYEYSIRLLQFLIDLGVPISLKSSRLINDMDWFYAFKEIYEYYPLATLYYSIQITDKDILKRIGQEYAYSVSLYESGIISFLLDKLLDAYLNSDTPIFYKGAILYIASELFIAVPATKWQSKFIKIWDEIFIPQFEHIDRRSDDLHDFIMAGLPFITPKYCKKIIIDCLHNANINRQVAIDCLFYLRGKRTKAIKYITDSEYQNSIDVFIEAICAPQDFTILGNIYDSLNKEQIQQIAHKATLYIKSNEGIDFPTYTLQSLSYFAKEEKRAQNVLKNIILTHPNLFYNGISDEGSFSYRKEILKVSKISDNLVWTQKELLQLYKKLSTSISQLTGSRWFEDSESGLLPINHVPLLKEMFAFLEKFKNRLKTQPSFDRIYGLVKSALVEKRKFVQIDEAMISGDSRVVVNGINELIEKIEITDVNANVTIINLLIDRVLFKRPESLLLALNAVWYILDRHKQKMSNLYSRSLLLILDAYKEDVCFALNLDIPKAYSHLIKIASILDDKGLKSSGIDYWIGIKESKRFNI